jgi:hypothetical protein
VKVGVTFALTVTDPVVLLQPVTSEVKVKVAVPAATPVTTPPGVTVATDVLLLVQVPPVVGFSVVVAPTQIELLPVMLTVGKTLTKTFIVAEVAHCPAVGVNV